MEADLNLDFATTEREGAVVVSVAGEVDAHTAPELRAHLGELLRSGARQVVVDLREVGLLDSTGLGVLLGAAQDLRDHEGDLAVVCGDTNVRRVFDITGVVGYLIVAGTVDEAVAGLR